MANRAVNGVITVNPIKLFDNVNEEVQTLDSWGFQRFEGRHCLVHAALTLSSNDADETAPQLLSSLKNSNRILPNTKMYNLAFDINGQRTQRLRVSTKQIKQCLPDISRGAKLMSPDDLTSLDSFGDVIHVTVNSMFFGFIDDMYIIVNPYQTSTETTIDRLVLNL